MISTTAVLISGVSAFLTWRWRTSERRKANVVAYFHRNSEYARVTTSSGEEALAGYNLVVWNKGPAEATDVALKIVLPDGESATLVSTDEGEFPIERLPADARYPIPWLLDNRAHQRARRVFCDVKWHDESGTHLRTYPVRRGQTTL